MKILSLAACGFAAGKKTPELASSIRRGDKQKINPTADFFKQDASNFFDFEKEPIGDVVRTLPTASPHNMKLAVSGQKALVFGEEDADFDGPIDSFGSVAPVSGKSFSEWKKFFDEAFSSITKQDVCHSEVQDCQNCLAAIDANTDYTTQSDCVKRCRSMGRAMIHGRCGFDQCVATDPASHDEYEKKCPIFRFVDLVRFPEPLVGGQASDRTVGDVMQMQIDTTQRLFRAVFDFPDPRKIDPAKQDVEGDKIRAAEEMDEEFSFAHNGLLYRSLILKNDLSELQTTVQTEMENLGVKINTAKTEAIEKAKTALDKDIKSLQDKMTAANKVQNDEATTKFGKLMKDLEDLTDDLKTKASATKLQQDIAAVTQDLTTASEETGAMGNTILGHVADLAKELGVSSVGSGMEFVTLTDGTPFSEQGSLEKLCDDPSDSKTCKYTLTSGSLDTGTASVDVLTGTIQSDSRVVMAAVDASLLRGAVDGTHQYKLTPDTATWDDFDANTDTTINVTVLGPMTMMNSEDGTVYYLEQKSTYSKDATGFFVEPPVITDVVCPVAMSTEACTDAQRKVGMHLLSNSQVEDPNFFRLDLPFSGTVVDNIDSLHQELQHEKDQIVDLKNKAGQQETQIVDLKNKAGQQEKMILQVQNDLGVEQTRIGVLETDIAQFKSGEGQVATMHDLFMLKTLMLHGPSASNHYGSAEHFKGPGGRDFADWASKNEQTTTSAPTTTEAATTPEPITTEAATTPEPTTTEAATTPEPITTEAVMDTAEGTFSSSEDLFHNQAQRRMDYMTDNFDLRDYQQEDEQDWYDEEQGSEFPESSFLQQEPLPQCSAVCTHGHHRHHHFTDHFAANLPEAHHAHEFHHLSREHRDSSHFEHNDRRHDDHRMYDRAHHHDTFAHDAREARAHAYAAHHGAYAHDAHADHQHRDHRRSRRASFKKEDTSTTTIAPPYSKSTTQCMDDMSETTCGAYVAMSGGNEMYGTMPFYGLIEVYRVINDLQTTVEHQNMMLKHQKEAHDLHKEAYDLQIMDLKQTIADMGSQITALAEADIQAATAMAAVQDIANKHIAATGTSTASLSTTTPA